MSSSNSRRRRRHDQYSRDDASSSAKRPRPGQQKKHIYLVIEDWKLGYNIHKLDIDDLLDSDATKKPPLGRLPEPCAIRIEAPMDQYPTTVTAIGRKILFVTDRYSDEAPMLRRRRWPSGIAPTPALRPLGWIFFVPVDDRLYALNPRRDDAAQCSFEVISREPHDGDENGSGRPDLVSS